jgi:hypothetical protein
LQKKFVSTHNTYARRRQWHRKSPKTWCRCLGWRGKGVGGVTCATVERA